MRTVCSWPTAPPPPPPPDQPTFYSRRWHTTSTPDIALCTEDLHGSIRREVDEQLGGNNHRPVFLQLNLGSSTEATFPRWNYKNANWTFFKHRTSTLSMDITVQSRDINMVAKDFNSSILKAAQETIPRGSRRNYRPYWSQTLQDLQDALSEARSSWSILHRRTTPNSNKPKPDFSGTRYRHAAEATGKTTTT